MKSVATMAVLIASVAAAPKIGASTNSPRDGVTVGQAIDACGNNLQLNCCNKVDNSVDIDNNSDVFGGLIGSLGGALNHDDIGLFDQCSSLSLSALIGVSSLLNNHCKQNVACCQNSPSNAVGGLINIALPCIAIGGIL
ncbi:Rodlet protein [Cladobotryum mycophilum]|uniref:Hydrophobin n=1 Tax=Cladobotryum mycophilum TaxID=491253 RepID=A0ABR0S8U0_9HYPO